MIGMPCPCRARYISTGYTHIHTYIMMKTANDAGRVSTIENYKNIIAQVYTEESEKSLQELKNAIKAQSVEYQEQKARLLRIEAEICAPLINKVAASYIAKAFYKNWGFDDAEKLERLIVDDKGQILRDGKPVVLQSLQQLASFADYFRKSLTKVARKVLDKESECVDCLLAWVQQGLPVDAVKATAFAKYGIADELGQTRILKRVAEKQQEQAQEQEQAQAE